LTIDHSEKIRSRSRVGRAKQAGGSGAVYEQDRPKLGFEDLGRLRDLANFR
jgi:hypothetical protein